MGVDDWMYAVRILVERPPHFRVSIYPIMVTIAVVQERVTHHPPKVLCNHADLLGIRLPTAQVEWPDKPEKLKISFALLQN